MKKKLNNETLLSIKGGKEQKVTCVVNYKKVLAVMDILGPKNNGTSGAMHSTVSANLCT